MRPIWRFFRDEAKDWRWQQLSEERAVLAESRSAFTSYDTCIADANTKGYSFECAQERLVRAGNVTASDGDASSGRRETGLPPFSRTLP